jgi:hypothetical protein
MGPSRAEMSDNWGADRKFAASEDRGRGGFGGGFRERDGGFRDRSRCGLRSAGDGGPARDDLCRCGGCTGPACREGPTVLHSSHAAAIALQGGVGRSLSCR